MEDANHDGEIHGAFVPEGLPDRCRRYTFLLTFAALGAAAIADGYIMPTTREQVAEIFLEAFAHCKVDVLQFIVAREYHENDAAHFHVVLKAATQFWYAALQQRLKSKGVCPNWKGVPEYSIGYRYLTMVTSSKPVVDEAPLVSTGHPEHARAIVVSRTARARQRRSIGAQNRPEAPQGDIAPGEGGTEPHGPAPKKAKTRL